ncbi:hypothetical protein [Bosea sp. AS-1]|uniref:hypothetical protein n=1 Tax=Bosea sp. AS-1 TaxID=2015316 RepID=UPI000B7829AD|nr:hypothetical protein [Bosea sp. AS-1]
MTNINSEGMVDVSVELATPDGDLLIEWIACLQSALDAVPPEARATAKLDIMAYDWEGVYASYRREPTQDELDAVAAKFRDAKSLADASTPAEIDEWVRALRLKTGSARAEAYDAVRAGAAPIGLHPAHPTNKRPARAPWRAAVRMDIDAQDEADPAGRISAAIGNQSC